MAKPTIDEIWNDFETGLSTALAELGSDSFVIAFPARDEHAETKPFMQFAGYDEGWIRAELQSNVFRAPSEQLTDNQVAQLLEFGWLEPTWSPGTEPDGGSPNFHFDAEPSAVMMVPGGITTSGSACVAAVVAATARDILGIAHPAAIRIG